MGAGAVLLPVAVAVHLCPYPAAGRGRPLGLTLRHPVRKTLAFLIFLPVPFLTERRARTQAGVPRDRQGDGRGQPTDGDPQRPSLLTAGLPGGSDGDRHGHLPGVWRPIPLERASAGILAVAS